MGWVRSLEGGGCVCGWVDGLMCTCRVQVHDVDHVLEDRVSMPSGFGYMTMRRI